MIQYLLSNVRSVSGAVSPIVLKSAVGSGEQTYVFVLEAGGETSRYNSFTAPSSESQCYLGTARLRWTYCRTELMSHHVHQGKLSPRFSPIDQSHHPLRVLLRVREQLRTNDSCVRLRQFQTIIFELICLFILGFVELEVYRTPRQPSHASQLSVCSNAAWSA